MEPFRDVLEADRRPSPLLTGPVLVGTGSVATSDCELLSNCSIRLQTQLQRVTSLPVTVVKGLVMLINVGSLHLVCQEYRHLRDLFHPHSAALDG